MTFKVQKKMCPTCIYKPGSPLDLKVLEDQVRDAYGGFKCHRICHHSKNACCRGFWDAHKDEFQMGQVSQRLDIVELVNIDLLKNKKLDIKNK
jgi:hypothetical protein